MSALELITTADGSHSLLNTSLHETYHSVHGAVQESSHVFLQQGLMHFRLRHPDMPIRALEVGFGTGLNTILAFRFARQEGIRLTYESWEKFPLDAALVAQLNYGGLLHEKAAFDVIHAAPWDEIKILDTGFSLHKRHDDITTGNLTSTFDVIFYDAFAPAKQPELWTIDVLRKVTQALNPGGIWVSYCAKGQVKRDLVSLGLKVETLPGPPGKKEMTRGSVKR